MQMPKQIDSKRILLKYPEELTFQLAQELYAVVDKSRQTLREWLPWVDKINSPEDEFTGFLLNVNRKNWQDGVGFGYLIYHKETRQFLGIVDLCHVSDTNKSAEIGYWLSDEATGFGYMQEAVHALEDTAFKAGINRIIIKNDTKNLRSVHVSKRAGYVLEGVMRQDAWDNYHNRFRDTNLWSKLKSDWEKHQN